MTELDRRTLLRTGQLVRRPEPPAAPYYGASLWSTTLQAP